MAGSAGGVLLLILFIVSLTVVISVVLYLKRRQKAFNLASNVAYAGQCKNEDIDYYSIPQPSPKSDVENKNEGVSLEQNVAYEPTKVVLSPSVAYGSHDLEAQQNVAYALTKVAVSPNVAYESHDHVHQGAESQDEYEYISNEMV